MISQNDCLPKIIRSSLTMGLVSLLMLASMVLPAIAKLPPTNEMIGQEIEVNPILGLAKTDWKGFVAHVRYDEARFAKSASQLEKMADDLFRPNSFLDRASNEKNLANDRQLRGVFRFWRFFLKHMAVLDEIAEKYRSGMKDRLSGNIQKAFEGYLLGIDANLCRLVVVSRLVGFTQGRKKLEVLLNEANKDSGIPERSFQHTALEAVEPHNLYRLYYFHLSHQEDLANFYKGDKTWRPDVDSKGLLKSYYDSYKPIADHLLSIVAKESAWYKYVFGKGSYLAKDFVFPLQRSIFTWVGDTRVRKAKSRCITPEQLHEMERVLQPGDMILERQEWFLSAYFLPGFWPHAEIYVGTKDALATKLDGDPAVRGFYQKQGYQGFMDYLEKKYPEKFRRYAAPNAKDNHPNVIMESTSDGVIFSSMEEANFADYLGALRPRLSPLDIAKSIDQAFYYIGREYDFHFDFITENDLVCTEFVCKSFAPAKGKKGLVFPLRVYMGDQILRADFIVESFDKLFGTKDQQQDFVYFLRGNPKGGIAVISDEPTFRRSYQWEGGLWSTRK